MSEWPFTPPTPETTEAVLSGLAGAVVGSFLRRTGSLAAWSVGVFTGFVISMTLGRWVVSVSGVDAAAVHSLLGLCGVPLALRLRRYAEKSKIGDLPIIEDESAT
jgi:hypothetical protein